MVLCSSSRVDACGLIVRVETLNLVSPEFLQVSYLISNRHGNATSRNFNRFTFPSQQGYNLSTDTFLAPLLRLGL